jgi:hypothetical protein
VVFFLFSNSVIAYQGWNGNLLYNYSDITPPGTIEGAYDMIQFRDYIKTFNSKDIEIVFGPVVNLSEIAEKRVKRKSIQLVRNVKKIRS